MDECRVDGLVAQGAFIAGWDTEWLASGSGGLKGVLGGQSGGGGNEQSITEETEGEDCYGESVTGAERVSIQ